MATKLTEVEVEVDLNEFSTDEIVSELCSRLRGSERRKVSIEQKRRLKKDVERLYLELQETAEIIPTKGLWDKMKLEHFCKIFNDYSLEQIETLLPKK